MHIASFPPKIIVVNMCNTIQPEIWRSLNLVVASQVCLSRSTVVSHLRYSNKAMSLQIYKK